MNDGQLGLHGLQPHSRSQEAHTGLLAVLLRCSIKKDINSVVFELARSRLVDMRKDPLNLVLHHVVDLLDEDERLRQLVLYLVVVDLLDNGLRWHRNIICNLDQVPVLEVRVHEVDRELNRAIYEYEALFVVVVVSYNFVTFLDVDVVEAFADVEDVLAADVDLSEKAQMLDLFFEELQLVRLSILTRLL